MKDKVRIRFVIVILLDISEVAHMKICKGFNGRSCCSGYEWDQGQSMCKPCKKGYHGISCGFKCPPLFFGLGCQSPCNCSVKDCDYIDGCRQITEEHPYNFTIGSNYYVKTTELNYYEHSYNDSKEYIDKTTPCKTSNQHTKRNNFLMFALIGLSIVSLIIVLIYSNTRSIENCLLVSTMI